MASHVDISSYQSLENRTDEIGRRVKTFLIEKAKQGVRVLFLYDEIDSHDLPAAYKDELKAAGIEVFAFHTQQCKGNRFQINFRNHRKVVVMDGRVARIGGHNVGDEFLGKNPKFGHWRDTHVRIEGPSVLKAQLSFFEDQYWANEKFPDLHWEPTAPTEGDQRVLIVSSYSSECHLTDSGIYLIKKTTEVYASPNRIWHYGLSQYFGRWVSLFPTGPLCIG